MRTAVSPSPIAAQPTSHSGAGTACPCWRNGSSAADGSLTESPENPGRFTRFSSGGVSTTASRAAGGRVVASLRRLVSRLTCRRPTRWPLSVNPGGVFHESSGALLAVVGTTELDISHCRTACPPGPRPPQHLPGTTLGTPDTCDS